MQERNGRELPATSYAVLGLLSHGELSGYDVMKLAQERIGHFFWKPAKSQIYSELRRLLAHGYATERDVEQEGRPDKRLHHLTPQGEVVLRAWLDRVEPNIAWNILLLKVFFAELMRPDALLAQLETFRQDVERRLAEYEAIEAHIKHIDKAFFPYLTLQFGLSQAHAQLAWVDAVVPKIERRAAAVPTEQRAL